MKWSEWTSWGEQRERPEFTASTLVEVELANGDRHFMTSLNFKGSPCGCCCQVQWNYWLVDGPSSENVARYRTLEIMP